LDVVEGGSVYSDQDDAADQEKEVRVSKEDRDVGTDLDSAEATVTLPETKKPIDPTVDLEEEGAAIATPTDEFVTAASQEKEQTKRNSDVPDQDETPTMAKIQAWKNSLWGRPSKRFARRNRRKKMHGKPKRQ
jgi:hypothetical protein